MGLAGTFQNNSTTQFAPQGKKFSIGPNGNHVCRIAKLKIYNKGQIFLGRPIESTFVRVTLVIVGDSAYYGKEIPWRIDVGSTNQFVRDRNLSLLSQLESQLDITSEPLRNFVIGAFGDEEAVSPASSLPDVFVDYSQAALRKALFRHVSIKIGEHTSKKGHVISQIEDFVVMKDVAPAPAMTYEQPLVQQQSIAQGPGLQRTAETFIGVPHPEPQAAPVSQPFNDEIPW